MTLRTMMTFLLLPSLHATCPADWTEDSATGKCYFLASWALGFHWDCARVCRDAASGEGSLACISSADEDAFVVSMIESRTDIFGTDQLPAVWIGNYQDPDDQGADVGWNQCSNGEETSYTRWFRNSTGAGCTDLTNRATPNNRSDDCFTSGPQAPTQPNEYWSTTRNSAQMSEDCVGLHPDGWYDERCAWRRYPCLCEHGMPTSAVYEAWARRKIPVWTSFYRARATVIMGVATVIAVLPALVMIGLAFCRSGENDWAKRVQVRVRRVMSCGGWIAIVYGMAPTVGLVAGRTLGPLLSGWDIGVAAISVAGLHIAALALTPGAKPSAESGFCCSIAVLSILFFLFAILGAFVFLLAQPWLPRSGWRTTAVEGWSLALLTISAGAFGMGITLSALRLRKDRARLARIWLAIRVWDAILFVDLIIQAILEFTNGFHDRGGPWLVTGLVAIFFAVASTSRVRASVSRFVATVGVKKDDVLEAEKAAKLVWLDIDVADPVAPASTEMAGGTVAA